MGIAFNYKYVPASPSKKHLIIINGALLLVVIAFGYALFLGYKTIYREQSSGLSAGAASSLADLQSAFSVSILDYTNIASGAQPATTATTTTKSNSSELTQDSVAQIDGQQESSGIDSILSETAASLTPQRLANEKIVSTYPDVDDENDE